jgi:hypothetical protein
VDYDYDYANEPEVKRPARSLSVASGGYFAYGSSFLTVANLTHSFVHGHTPTADSDRFLILTIIAPTSVGLFRTVRLSFADAMPIWHRVVGLGR